MPELPSPRPAATRRIPIAIGAVLIGAVIGFAGVYGIGGLKRNASGRSGLPRRRSTWRARSRRWRMARWPR